MSRMETLLAELDSWQEDDLQALYQVLVQRLMNRHSTTADRMKRLQQYAGAGRGVWQGDAQHHITSLREDREV
ncbi:MAG: hypothetical protein SF053_18275 [Bacteroidia bacterium]|nr:hypothetical protein [Bacteroidia bacterium]